MRGSKGFSLIETLVAISLASIATLALMHVISHASNTSANALNRFDSSLMMSVAASQVNENMHGRTMSMYEILSARYQIDHPRIAENLKESSFHIRYFPKEMIDPFISMNLSAIDPTASQAHIFVQKTVLENKGDKRIFFRMPADTQ
jgi:prepilin-type N-terminal cleavage/methylation domain-containing protein